MERRTFLRVSGVTLTSLLAGCLGGDNGDDADLTIEWNYQRYAELDSPGGGTFVTDEETEYVGVELRITNHTNSEVSILDDSFGLPAYRLHVDGDNEPVSMHLQSQTEGLESIPAGETVSASLIFTIPPDAGPLTFELLEGFPNADEIPEAEITRDESLEIDFEGEPKE